MAILIFYESLLLKYITNGDNINYDHTHISKSYLADTLPLSPNPRSDLGRTTRAVMNKIVSNFYQVVGPFSLQYSNKASHEYQQKYLSLEQTLSFTRIFPEKHEYPPTTIFTPEFLLTKFLH